MQNEAAAGTSLSTGNLNLLLALRLRAKSPVL